jgi:hypothetical protein
VSTILSTCRPGGNSASCESTDALVVDYIEAHLDGGLERRCQPGSKLNNWSVGPKAQSDITAICEAEGYDLLLVP